MLHPRGRRKLPILRFVRACQTPDRRSASRTRPGMAHRLLPLALPTRRMQSPFPAFPAGGLGNARPVAPLEAFSRTEKIIALSRVLLATATLLVVIVDPHQPSFSPNLAYAILTAYALYSAVIFALVRGEYVRQEPAPFRTAITGALHIGPYSAAGDVIWVTIISMFTERGTSPFFLLHVFVISSVSMRWGLRATLTVTIILAFSYPAALLASHWISAEDLVLHRAHIVRPIYLLVLGYLIGYPGEHERRSKRRLGLMVELPAAFRRKRPPGAGLVRVMRRALDHFEAQRALLVLRDPDSGRYFTWELTRRGKPTRIALRITQADPLPLPFAAPTEGFVANELRPGTAMALCFDVLTGALSRKYVSSDLEAFTDDPPQVVLAAPVLIQRELRGRALLTRPAGDKFTRDDLDFLLLLVAQAAAGFETVRLQGKAEELAVLEERARIARDLHDGFIQALAGIDLRVEAAKLLLRRDPARVPKALEDLHVAVDSGYREVRHYLTVLRQASRQDSDLGSTLDRLAAEFAIRERLKVHMARPQADPGLPVSTAYELTQIVREALHNAVRHGHATQAVVKLGARPSHVYLVIRDNGRGFPNGDGSSDGDGFLKPASAPWSIRERTAALGGSLRGWSKPGHGSDVSLLIPVAGAQHR